MANVIIIGVELREEFSNSVTICRLLLEKLM